MGLTELAHCKPAGAHYMVVKRKEGEPLIPLLYASILNGNNNLLCDSKKPFKNKSIIVNNSPLAYKMI